MKLLQVAIALAAVSVCACSVPSPTAPSAGVTTSAAVATTAALASADGFDPSFYRAFVQNGFESPDRLAPIHLLTSPLHIYMQTRDDAGRAVDAATLESTANILSETARVWSGDTFGVAEITRGTATRENTAGWITIKWSTAATPDRCGRSTIGVDGGFIEFNVSGSCSCGLATAIYPRLVRHELGHAMGYYHTDDPGDVMYGQSITTAGCDLLPSDRERRHALIAHSERR